jgi:hypothetical protein
MATKESIVTGIGEVVVEAKRVAGILDERADWDTKRDQGWTPREIFSHLASVAGMFPMMGPALLNAPEDADLTTSNSIADLNAASIASLANLTPAQLVQAIETNYGKTIEWLNALEDAQMARKMTFAQLCVPAGDIVENIAVLHANHHLYEAVMPVAM